MQIPNRQAQLDDLARKYLADGEPNHNGHRRRIPPTQTDQVIIDKARAERGGKFDRLWRGDTSDYGHDASSADDGFVHKLWSYTQDDEQVKRIHAASGLHRAKSGRRADYLQRSIDRAQKNVTWFYDWETHNAPRPNEHPPHQDPDGSSYSHHIGTEFGENKNPLPLKTVEDILAEAGEEVPWVVENLLARGAVTDFSGLAKKGGKTTFWCHAIAAGARGDDHAGFSTESAKYLYLTEQGNNFAQPLRESGLVEHPDYMRVLRFKDVSGLKWNTLIMRAGAEAHRLGFDALVVDTFAVFAGLKGSEENDSGPVADRMRVLRLVAQKYDLAVLLIRHAGKDGTPRGSSAFEAEADICVVLSRPEGRHAPSVRKLVAIGRYGEWERNVQLDGGRFVSLGVDDKVEFNKAVGFIKAVLPESPDDGMKKQEILDKRTGDKDISASTLDRALKWLTKKGSVGAKQLVHEQGKPKVYWLAYEPPAPPPDPSPPGNEEGDVCFHQTTPVYGENKTEPEDGEVADVAEDVLGVFEEFENLRSEPLTPEQVAKYQRLRREGMKEDLAIAEARRAKS